jgi:D-glycero-beta-D-manno-heptose-7-phosphate kinase
MSSLSLSAAQSAEAIKLQIAQKRDRLLDLIDRFSTAQVLVVGDLTLDEFLTGQIERVSREAPVMILRHEQTRQIPGGGANAIYNFAKLGAQVKAVGLVGDDVQGRSLLQIFESAGIDISGILVEGDRPTVTKTRISGHARQSVTQQIVRVDRKSEALPAEPLSAQLADYIKKQILRADAVVCSDYGEGVLSPQVIAAAIQHPRCIVDAQKHLDRFRGATLFTPNLPEAELALGYSLAPTGDPTNDLARIRQGGQDLLALTAAQSVLITRGDEGMSLLGRDRQEVHIPAFNRTDVFDVTGAGDTVVAGLTLGLIAGADLWEATVLGNLAASLVVRQFGTATTSQAELKAALLALLEA